MVKTTDDLLESIKLRSMAPTSQTTFNDTRLLTLMTQELRSYVVPKIIGVREDFFLDYKDTAVTADRQLYPLVERAIGNSLKALTYIDTNGNENPVYRTEINAIRQFTTAGSPTHFLLMGDNIRALPVPSTSGGYLRQYFFRATSELVKTNAVGLISTVAKGATQTVFTIGTDLTASVSAGDMVDFQSALSPFQLKNHDITVQNITATTVTVNNSDIEDSAGEVRIVVGDYLCQRLQTNIPQVPIDYHTLLVQRVVVKIYESLNDSKKYMLAAQDLKEMERDLFGLIKSRVEAQPKKVKNRGILDSIGM